MRGMRDFGWLRAAVMVAALVLSCAGETRAGAGAWTGNGPTGGAINAIVISPDFSKDNTLFIGTAAGVYKTTDGGATWAPVVKGLTDPAVLSLAISPDFAFDGTLFAGTARGKVFRSSDGGSNWAAVTDGLPQSTPTSSSPVTRLAISPGFREDRKLFAGIPGKGVFRTEDAGREWRQRNNGLPNSFVTGLKVSPGFKDDETVFVTLGGSGFFKSNNEGMSWNEKNRGFDTDSFGAVRLASLAVSPGYPADGTLFAGTGKFGAARTDDDAQLWRERRDGLPQNKLGAFFPIITISFSPDYTADQTLFAGAQGHGAFRTVNDGRDWAAVNTGLTADDVNAFAVSPAFAADRTVYAATSSGVFKSADGGVTWALSSNGITLLGINSVAPSPGFATDKTILVGTTGGVFKSTDGGVTWTQADGGLTNFTINSVALSPGFPTDRTGFIGTGAGIFRTSDGGATWAEADFDIAVDVETGKPGPVSAVALSPNFPADGKAFAATDFGVFRTDKSGDDWTQVIVGMGNVPVSSLAVSPDFARDETVFAGLPKRGVYRTGDEGAHWRPVNQGVGNRQITSLALSPGFAVDKAGFAGAVDTPGGRRQQDARRKDRHHLFATDDEGLNWDSSDRGIEGRQVSVISLSPSYPADRTLFIGTDGGVFKTTDGGATWAAMNDGLVVLGVGSLAASPDFAVDRTVFAGVGGRVQGFTIP